METVFIVAVALVVITGVVIYVNRFNSKRSKDEEEYVEDKTA